MKKQTNALIQCHLALIFNYAAALYNKQHPLLKWRFAIVVVVFKFVSTLFLPLFESWLSSENKKKNAQYANTSKTSSYGDADDSYQTTLDKDSERC